jgi:transposase
VKGKTWWQWTFGCATAVYHVIAPTRGKCVPTDFLGGVKPQMWLSDRLAAQWGHAEQHQFCLAHLIRDAQYAIDHGDTIFASGLGVDEELPRQGWLGRTAVAWPQRRT